jgi:parallel beta-helix repeat protein
MQALRKIAPVLILPAIALLVVACERTSMPTEPASAVSIGPPSSYLFGFSSSTTHWVNHDDPNGGAYLPPGTSCDNPGYPTIQLAVLAAGPGDRINVCPGLYEEQVTITAPKNNLRLRSVQPWQAIIKAPAVMVPPAGDNAIVRITAAENVSIVGFTITGPGSTGCGSLGYGVRVEAAGSAIILGNHITQIRDNPFGGCQNGVAVGVGRTTPASAWIIGNLIDNYQKNGPTVSFAGSSAVIAYNRVLGVGPTALIAQNGIQASSGATATIFNNFVAQNTYIGTENAASTGIILFGPGQVITDHNSVTSNDYGVYMFGVAAGSRAADNRVRASTYDGVIVDASNGTRVAHNMVDHNSGPGISMYDEALNNILEDNRVEENDDSGILLDLAGSNTVRRNRVVNNGTPNGDMTDGIRVNLGSLGNTIRDNRLTNNVKHDCHDVNETGNAWINNRGRTSSPPGLCRGGNGGREDDRGERESAFGWNASFPWYLGFGEMSNPAGTATINAESLLQSLPATRTSATRPTSSPHQ